MRHVCIIILTTILLGACTLSFRHSSKDGGDDSASIPLRHSELLSIEEHDGYKLVRITDPWDSAHTLHSYVLIPRNTAKTFAPPSELAGCDVIRIPVERVVVYTSVHCGLLQELGAYSNICGVCDLQYINLPQLHQDVKSGHIADLGETMTPNIEAIIDLQPDAILLSPFENSGGYGKLGKLGIPLVECADYMEASPLGRAEWMRFYGLLLGKETVADSLFQAIEDRYTAEAKNSSKARSKSVVTEMKIGSTWYIAGGESTVGLLLSDVGADYIFKTVNTRGAVPYSPEAAFEKAKDADIWLIKYNQATDMTLENLAEDWSMNAHMKAFKEGRVYGCNLSRTRFFEETPFHPDILLTEYRNILDGVPDTELKYYKRLK